MGKTFRKYPPRKQKEDMDLPKPSNKPKRRLEKYKALELLREANDGYDYPVFEELD